MEHQVGAMTQGDVNGKHGFLFHDDCWALVKQAYHPTPVPLERLYDAHNSVPLDRIGGYLGLVAMSRQVRGLRIMQGRAGGVAPGSQPLLDRSADISANPAVECGVTALQATLLP